MLGFNSIAELSLSQLSDEETIDALTGSYIITGQSADITASYNVPSDVGSYNITGQDSDFTLGKGIIGDAGSYTITGQDAEMPVGSGIQCDAGAYTLTGQDITFKYISIATVAGMAKGYLGYNGNGLVVRHNMTFSEDGYPILFIEEKEILRVTLDLTGLTNETTETVSSATIATNNLTAVAATSGNKTVITVSNVRSSGDFTVTTTLSSGAIHIQKVICRNMIRLGATKDYKYAS